jgi:hypothetical protein
MHVEVAAYRSDDLEGGMADIHLLHSVVCSRWRSKISTVGRPCSQAVKMIVLFCVLSISGSHARWSFSQDPIRFHIRKHPCLVRKKEIYALHGVPRIRVP